MTDHLDQSTLRALDALWHPDINPNPLPNRHAVRAALQSLADGNTFADDLAFAQALARALLRADADAPKAANQRAQAIMKAAGLAGDDDRHRAFCEHVENLAFGNTASGIRSAIEHGLFPNPDGKDAADLFRDAEKVFYRKRKKH